MIVLCSKLMLLTCYSHSQRQDEEKLLGTAVKSKAEIEAKSVSHHSNLHAELFPF